MKQLILISFAVLVLAACGKEEPAQPAVDEPATIEDQATTDADSATESTEADAAEEVMEVVEESASEPDADEQAILLAQADTTAVARDWQFSEGQHYTRLVPTQPTLGDATKIEVAEFFWYGCPHCYSFESLINTWAETAPANVRFVRIPAMWNAALVKHAQLYYTEEILVRNGVIKNGAEFRNAVFEEYHRRGNRLTSDNAIQSLFARFGVSPEEFGRTWQSFEVAQKMRMADDLARRYSISSVPMMVVNGKFRTSATEAGSYPNLPKVLDELVARESAR